MEKDNITMSRKQLNRFDILSKVNAGFITVREASEALGLSERQVKRLKKKVREQGADGVVHKNSGRAPANKISNEVKKEILRIFELPEHKGVNFSHFVEILDKHYGIYISYGSFYSLMREEGIKSPKKTRRLKPHRRRKRKAQAGLLLQVDATPFAWFNGDNRRYSLHGGIDDATGQITGLYMCKNECLHGYFEMLRRTLQNFGAPVSIYADRHTIFQSPNAKRHEIDSSVPVNDTQFGRCLKELSVTLLSASSPQAKGRIERLWGTLQSRLPVEFALKGIKTVETANEFLKSYIYDFNANFAVEPENTQNAFRKISPEKDIEHTLCVKEKRSIDAGKVFSYGGKSFMIDAADAYMPAKTKVDVLVGPRIGVMVAHRGQIIATLPFLPQKRMRKEETALKQTRTTYHPPDNHSWKYGVLMGVCTFGERQYESEEAYLETVRVVERALLGKQR